MDIALLRLTMQSISLTNLMKATGGSLHGDGADCDRIDRIEIDSRQVRPGDLFWALQGDRFDGHDFVDDAHRNGARVCLVHKQAASLQVGPMIEVEDTLKALWDYSAWHRKRQRAVVVAVTGSFGKTTTREMIHAALRQTCVGTRSPQNFNNHIGMPLSLLSVNHSHKYAILELGASRVGEIRDLSSIAKPDVGVVTGVGPAHLDGFGSETRIAQAKAELLQSLDEPGLAVLVGDDPRVRRMAREVKCRVVFVGQQEHNDVTAKNVTFTNIRLNFDVDGFPFELPVAGRHHLNAALAAIAIARDFGLSYQDIASGLAGFEPMPGRCRIEKIGTWNIIDDSYNSNPTSIMAACQLLKDWRGATRKILVTGDMLELNHRTQECHLDIGRYAAAAGIDRILAFGRAAKHVVLGALESGMDPVCVAPCLDFEQGTQLLIDWLEPNDVILVKGSRGMRMERIIERLRLQASVTFQETRN